MRKMKITKNWFWKTLFGYTVTFVTLDSQYTVRHRPFRAPDMIRKNPNRPGMRGMKYEAVIFDEVVRMRPADIEKLRAIYKQHLNLDQKFKQEYLCDWSKKGRR